MHTGSTNPANTELIITLAESLGSEDHHVRRKALVALEQIGTHHAISLLVSQMEARGAEKSWSAARAINKIIGKCERSELENIASLLQETIERLGRGQDCRMGRRNS